MTDKVVTLTLSKEFATFLESVHRQHQITVDTINRPILALDPGETTGVAEFDGELTIQVSQRETKQIGPSFEWLQERLQHIAFSQPDEQPRAHLRYEDYRVYEWKSTSHSWS